MIKLSEFGKNFLWTTKIELPDFTDENGNVISTGDFITLREPTSQEIFNIAEEGKENVAVFAKIFPACVVDTSIMKDESTKATGEEIKKALAPSGSTFSEIIETWIKSIPFQKRLQKPAKSNS